MAWRGGKVFTGIYYGKYDKIVHGFACAALTVVLLSFLPIGWAATAAFGAGAFKELFDWLIRNGKIGLGDLIADAVGILAVVLLYVALMGGVLTDSTIRV